MFCMCTLRQRLDWKCRLARWDEMSPWRWRLSRCCCCWSCCIWRKLLLENKLLGCQLLLLLVSETQPSEWKARICANSSRIEKHTLVSLPWCICEWSSHRQSSREECEQVLDFQLLFFQILTQQQRKEDGMRSRASVPQWFRLFKMGLFQMIINLFILKEWHLMKTVNFNSTFYFFFQLSKFDLQKSMTVVSSDLLVNWDLPSWDRPHCSLSLYSLLREIY